MKEPNLSAKPYAQPQSSTLKRKFHVDLLPRRDRSAFKALQGWYPSTAHQYPAPQAGIWDQLARECEARS